MPPNNEERRAHGSSRAFNVAFARRRLKRKDDVDMPDSREDLDTAERRTSLLAIVIVMLLLLFFQLEYTYSFKML